MSRFSRNGSGSSRHSPRNRFVAHQLQQLGLATLLMDLLVAEEEQFDKMSGGRLRFDNQDFTHHSRYALRSLD